MSKESGRADGNTHLGQGCSGISLAAARCIEFISRPLEDFGRVTRLHSGVGVFLAREVSVREYKSLSALATRSFKFLILPRRDSVMPNQEI